MQIYPSKELTDVSNLTRDKVVPFYRWLIIHEAPDEEIKRVNNLILSKWTVAGLIYIKEKAWKGNEHRLYNYFSNDSPN